MEDVPRNLRDVSKCGFYVWDSHAMKIIGNKCNGCSPKSTYEQDEKEAERQGGNEMEMVEVPVNDRADKMSVENGTAFNVRVFNVSE